MRRSAMRLLARAAQQQSHEVQVLASCQSMTTGALSARLSTTAASQSLRSWFSSSRPEAHAAKDAPPPPPGEGEAAAGPSQEGAAADSGERQLSPEQLSAELEAKSQELAEAQKQVSDLKDRWLRAQADMENLRERTSRQVAEAKQFAVQGLVKSLLEVADNLERAAAAVPEEAVAPEGADPQRALALLRTLREGVLMTDAVLMRVLEREGVTRYDPLGQEFDPNVHNALLQVPDLTRPPNTVALVLKKGYMLHDRAVRAAEVGVTPASQ